MQHKGFTLVEFIVILSIFAIMAAVALINFTGFRSNVAINNLAQDIALSVRQAQVFGWATLTEGQITDQPTSDKKIHGIFFPAVSGGGYDTSFILYTKAFPGGTGAYLANTDTVADTLGVPATSEIFAMYVANTRSDLTTLDANGVPVSGAIPLAGDVSLAFSRPRPEAMFFEGQNQLVGPTENFLGIYIRPKGATSGSMVRVITVSRFGEIGVY